MSWAEEELAGIDLGDKRLNKRAVRMLDCFAGKPTLSIPGACNGWPETLAAYRFFEHEDVEWSDILSPHQQQTQTRMREHAVVLCLEDTTELDFNGQQIEGLGRLSYEAQRGMYLHPTYAVTTERVPLGVLNAWMWARKEKEVAGSSEGKAVTGEQDEAGVVSETDEKESIRWIKGYEGVGELAKTMGSTRLVYVTDREGDIMELLVKAREMGNPADWLIRSQHNRVLPAFYEDKLWPTVEAQEPVATISFTLRSRRKGKGKATRKAREVHQQLFVKRVELRDGKGGIVPATCIVAKESDPPAGEDAVIWRLLTNREASTPEEVIELINWYRARWEIEIFFDVLKNGCRIEALQLSTIDRVERALVLYLIVAWRIAHLMRLGKVCPDMDARLLFDPEEIQAAYLLSKKRLPKSVPRLNDVIRLIAQLGGFLGRKGDGEPGVKTLWLGLQRLVDFIAGMHAARDIYV